MKKLSDMTIDEIIDNALQERGIDPRSEEHRKEYPVELIRAVQRDDIRALIELLKIGVHYTPARKV